MPKRVKKWMGSQTKCDLCRQDLNEHPTFYDARTETGPWGLLCLECFQLYGVGLGAGMGQEYDSTTKEKLRG